MHRTCLLTVCLAALLAAPSLAQTTHVVNQTGQSFSPQHLVIDVGDTVNWVWSAFDHTVTEGTGPIPTGGEAFNALLDAAHPTVSVTFDEEFLATFPRTNHVYPYYCIPHFAMGMTGSITVREVYGIYMNGAQEVPANGSAGVGNGLFKLNRATNEILWSYSYGGLGGAATMAHFHGPAPVGMNAGVQITLTTATPNIDTDFVSATQENQIRNGLWYLNIHTAGFPGGEIRGQIVKGTWTNLGGGSPGIAGTPRLRGFGPLTGLSTISLELTSGPPSALCLLWISLGPTVPQALFGGTVHTIPFVAQNLLGTDPNGRIFGGVPLPAGLPAGTQLGFQFLLADASTPFGVVLSNAQKATTP